MAVSMEGLGSGMVVRETEIYLGVADVRIIVLRLFRKSWWRTGGCNSLADGDVIEEESLCDGVANGELEEDFCMAGELSSS